MGTIRAFRAPLHEMLIDNNTAASEAGIAASILVGL